MQNDFSGLVALTFDDNLARGRIQKAAAVQVIVFAFSCIGDFNIVYAGEIVLLDIGEI